MRRVRIAEPHDGEKRLARRADRISLGRVAAFLAAAVCLLAALLLQIYLVASWHCWWQGASLGSRMLSNSTLIFALGLASLWSHARGRLSWAPAALTLFLIFWNALLTAQYMTGMIPPEKPVSAQTLAANQARVLPFAWRHWRAK